MLIFSGVAANGNTADVFRSAIRQSVDALLKRARSTLRRANEPPIDLRRDAVAPAGVLPGLLMLPLEKARTSDLYPVAEHVFHVAALRARAAADAARGVIEETLTCYRHSVDYRNGADRMGIPDALAPAVAACPAWFRLRPWDATSVADRLSDLAESMMRAGLQRGVQFALPEHAFLVTGNEAMIRLQAQRVLDLVQSVDRVGYVRSNNHDGDIKADLLIGEQGEWAWQIRQGNHRAAVAYAFGITELPVRIVGAVYRQNAEHWPNVRRGVFSVEGARAVFDNLLAGRLSNSAMRWRSVYPALLAASGVQQTARARIDRDADCAKLQAACYAGLAPARDQLA